MKSFQSLDDINQKLHKAKKKPVIVKCCQIDEAFEVQTMEGVMQGKAGDWLMVGVEGELYACDNEIFRKTYHLLEDCSEE